MLSVFKGKYQLSWAIIGVLAGIISAFAISNVEIKGVGQYTVGLIVTMIFLQIGEIAQRDRTADILGGYYELRKDRELQNHIEQIIRYMFTVMNYKNKLFITKAQNLLDTFDDELSVLADGRLHVGANEDLLFTIELIDMCKKEAKASSWQDKIDYWESPEGENYIKAHERFIEGGGTITRIFILYEKEIKPYERIMDIQAKIGVNVRVATIETLPTECLEGFVVYDDVSVRTEVLVSGFHKSSTLSIDQNEIHNYVRKFEDLYLRSIPLDEALAKHAISK